MDKKLIAFITVFTKHKLMMKKIILFLVVAVVLTIFSACSEQNNESISQEDETVEEKEEKSGGASGKNKESEDENEDEKEKAVEERKDGKLVGINPEDLTDDQEDELELEIAELRFEFDTPEKQNRLDEIFAMLGTTQEEYEREKEEEERKKIEEQDEYSHLSLREKLDKIRENMTEEEVEYESSVRNDPEKYNFLVNSLNDYMSTWNVSNGVREGLVKFPEGAERVDLDEDSIVFSSYRQARQNMPIVNVQTDSFLFGVFYIAEMEFEDGNIEELLIEQFVIENVYEDRPNTFSTVNSAINFEHDIDGWEISRIILLDWF